jgi:hypothetical protein
MLTNMMFAEKEKINLLLGDRVSQDEIYVTNATVPFEGEPTSVSLGRIPGFQNILGSVIYANRAFRERGGLWDRFVLFSCHSHPRLVGEIVPYGYEAWSVDDVPPEYESLRGRIISAKDRDDNLIYFSLKDKSDGKSGDDLFMEQVANKWRVIENQFWVHPPFHLVGKPMTRDAAVDCFKYDPEMKLGKIRKIPIAPEVLTPEQLKKTIFDPNLSLYYVEEKTGKLVLPYRRRR